MSKNLYLLFISILIPISAAHADFSVDQATRDIVKTYAFDPAKMPVEEQHKRVQGVAELWARVHDTPDTYLPALRNLLSQKDNKEFLFCDGGMLLLDESTLPADKSLGVDSIKKCTLSAIEQAGYFYTLHKLALDGEDTLELQFKILGKPDFQVFDSSHNLTLDQDFAFLYPLLVQDESRYFNRIAERLRTEKNTTALQSLLAAIFYAATHDSEKTLSAVAEDKKFPPAVRIRSQVFLKRIADMRKIEPDKIYEWMKQNRFDLSVTASENDLRTARRNRMRDISHDALRELDIYTMLLFQVLKPSDSAK